ncbi:hypothetical protein [Novimethylophilus kurashikiensis]|uniref:hypothetical protein n=1 Tax=Novimethylophilus kurashikiensis TaxID=1825523 RepID=UPI0011B1D4DA|nr:hypothetical protein [Novimethylophilus kurashikiensis]
MGWYFDLWADSITSIASRVYINPDVVSGIAAFAVNLPNGQPCTPSGTGAILAFDFATGKTVLKSRTTNDATASRIDGSGVITDLSLINIGAGALDVQSGNSAGTVNTDETIPPKSINLKRLNWREVPNVE